MRNLCCVSGRGKEDCILDESAESLTVAKDYDLYIMIPAAASMACLCTRFVSNTLPAKVFFAQWSE